MSSVDAACVYVCRGPTHDERRRAIKSHEWRLSDAAGACVGACALPTGCRPMRDAVRTGSSQLVAALTLALLPPPCTTQCCLPPTRGGHAGAVLLLCGVLQRLTHTLPTHWVIHAPHQRLAHLPVLRSDGGGTPRSHGCHRVRVGWPAAWRPDRPSRGGGGAASSGRGGGWPDLGGRQADSHVAFGCLCADASERRQLGLPPRHLHLREIPLRLPPPPRVGRQQRALLTDTCTTSPSQANRL
jgi:hypothetical protein